MSTIIDLSGMTALVTGASQGIGAAIARTLHRSGARVVVNHPDKTGGKIAQDAQKLVDELSFWTPTAPLSVPPMSAIPRPWKR